MLYAEDLVQKCGHPDCDCTIGTKETPLFFNSKCHTRAPLFVSYYDGRIIMSCSICDGPVATVAVARRREIQ